MHPAPKSSLESLKRELESRSPLPQSPLPEIRESVSSLLPEFINNLSAFKGKPEYGTFFGLEESKKKFKESPKLEFDVEFLKSLSASKWNEIGKKYKNLAQENSSKDLPNEQLKLGAIYFLTSTLSYLQGSIIREKDFLSEYTSCQELLHVTVSRLIKYQLNELLALIYLLDSTFCMFAIEFAHKRIKQCKSKIESLVKISKEENVSKSIQEQENLIKNFTEFILKFSESSIRRTRESSKAFSEFYEKYHKFGPLTLFTPIVEIGLNGFLILSSFIQEKELQDFINLFVKDE